MLTGHLFCGKMNMATVALSTYSMHGSSIIGSYKVCSGVGSYPDVYKSGGGFPYNVNFHGYPILAKHIDWRKLLNLCLKSLCPAKNNTVYRMNHPTEHTRRRNSSDVQEVDERKSGNNPNASNHYPFKYLNASSLS